MNNERFDAIINEEITRFVNESFIDEKRDGGILDMIKKYLGKHKKKDKKKNKKVRKLAHGGKEYYDYDEYEKTNRKLSQGDASSISQNIDMEKTNIASVARDIFGDTHTDEGAQSQLRKILNGERPMTKKIARKINKMIANGKIAVK